MTGGFRFLLDEHIHIGVADELARMGFDAIHVRDLGMLGASDDLIFKQASDDRRIVVTRDIRDFMRLARFHLDRGAALPGLLLVPSSFRAQQPGPLAQAIQAWTIRSGSDDSIVGGVAWLSSDSRQVDGSGFVQEAEPAYRRTLRRLEATV